MFQPQVFYMIHIQPCNYKVVQFYHKAVPAWLQFQFLACNNQLTRLCDNLVNKLVTTKYNHVYGCIKLCSCNYILYNTHITLTYTNLHEILFLQVELIAKQQASIRFSLSLLCNCFNFILHMYIIIIIIILYITITL